MCLVLPDAFVSERMEEKTDDLLLDGMQTKLIPPPVTLAFRKAMAERRKAMGSLDEEATRHLEVMTAHAGAAKERMLALGSANEKASSLAQQQAETMSKVAKASAAGRQAETKNQDLDQASAAFQAQQEKLSEAQKAHSLKKAEKEKMLEKFNAELQALEEKIDEARQESEKTKTVLEQAEINKRAAGELKEQQRKEAEAAREELSRLAQENEDARNAADAREVEFEEASRSLNLQVSKLQDAKLKKAKQERIYELIKGVWSSISGGKPPGVDMAFGSVFAAAMEYDADIMDSSTPWLVLLTRAREELRGAVQAYNKFVAASTQIREIAPDIYAKCVEADQEIRERGLNEIRTLCLGTVHDLSEEDAEDHCGNGLFQQLDVELDVLPAVSQESGVASVST